MHAAEAGLGTSRTTPALLVCGSDKLPALPRDSTHLQLLQRAVHAGQRGGAVRAVHHQLGNHGVVVHPHLQKYQRAVLQK